MPRAFDNAEQLAIRSALKEAARERFSANGISKTTLDELTHAAGISKASFYRFYPSKEVLFFSLLEEDIGKFRNALLSEPLPEKEARQAKFKELMTKVFETIVSSELTRFMGREEDLQVVIRRVPSERLLQHERDDIEFLDELIARWSTKLPPPERDEVSARISVMVLVASKKSFMRDHLYPYAVKAVIESLSDCLFE